MSFLVPCPHCGPRDVSEFSCRGESSRRPLVRPSLRELAEYVHFRDNCAGLQQEWWQHRLGCGLWFVALRDTRSNEVVESAAPGSEPPLSERGRLGQDPKA